MSGSNYRSYAMRSYLQELSVIQSFSKAGVTYDNSVVESFFSSLKREELYRTKYRSEAELRAAIDAYMVFYNERQTSR
ncbi:MAG: integrase core domain-containing protein [Massiliimalia sp.]|jgi:putative transposase